MNADIPTLRCWVRLPFISENSGVEEAYAFAVQSYGGRSLGFHCMMASGAHYRGVPIHAIALRPDAEETTLAECQLWDCFSARPVVHVFDYLRDHKCIAYTRGGQQRGRYLFTVDWLPETQEKPGFTMTPEQNKCAHVIALDTGNLCALPTNRIAWTDSYFVGENPSPRDRGYRVQSEVYRCEGGDFDVSQDERYMYRVNNDKD
jgi:hypothetical protein